MTFIAVFMAVWLCAVAYVGSVVKLAFRLRQLKRQGRAMEAPDILNIPFESPRALGWLLTGRYASLGDEATTRWAGIARVLFLLTFPMMLGFFAAVLFGLITPA